MKNIIVNKLFDSFVQLERAITSAKSTLERKEDVPQEIVDRISYYEEILKKQRALAVSLCRHLARGNWDEVSRHMRLINGLSAMIRDDARDILAQRQLEPAPQARIEQLLPL